MRGKGVFSLQKKWQATLSTTIALGMLLASVPAEASQPGERRGNIEIEAQEELALEKTSSRPSASDLVVIQLSGPVREQWKDELEDMGVKLGDYIPDYAFLAKLPSAEERKEIEQLSFVKKVIPYHPQAKLAPQLRSTLGKNKPVEVAVIGFDQKVDMLRTVSRLADEANIKEIESPEIAPHISIVTMDEEAIGQVIESEDVIAIIPVPENQLHNDIAATIVHADELASTGYTGKGQIVGVADTGLDTGDVKSIHPDFQGQVNSLYAMGRQNDASDRHGHGTHVAGAVLGTGQASNGQYKGMAPDAKLVFHSIEDRSGKLVTDVETILQEAYEDGARIHSDSWGADDNGAYSLSSFLFDRFLWEHPDMTALVAAGNAGWTGYQSVGSPATAKNVIAVGATENVRPNLGSHSDNKDEVWTDSSRGLTEDGRLKPDIVAPGTSILSTRSSLAPSKNFDKRFNDYYAYMSGTSLATPILAGGVAQIRQFLDEQGEKEPSGALLKAILLTSADDLGEDMRKQGFGRANLARAIQTSYKDVKDGLRTREKAEYAVKVTDSSQPLAITLAWTDYPASFAARRTLVNDLNLKVTTPSGERLNGNDFFEAPYDDQVDNLNNVEQIWIVEPEKGTYTVTVEGYNIPKGPQPYAIATTGTWAKVKDEEEKEDGKDDDNGQEDSEPYEVRNELKKGTLNKKTPYREYVFRTFVAGELSLSLEWDEDADLQMYVYDNNGKELAAATGTDNPETLKMKLPKSGLYKIRLELADGKEAKYRLDLRYPGKTKKR